MKLEVKLKPQFVYKLRAIKRDAEGNEISRRESAELPNVFTNWGVESLFGANGGDTPSTIAGIVGTGNTTPAITQTNMATFKAGRYTSTGLIGRTWTDLGSNQGYVQMQWRTIFAVGVATGNISEVGAAFQQSNPTALTNICSRALVVDGVGNPTTFEVLADEELQLDQFFRVYVDYSDRVTVVNVNGVDYTVTLRPMGLGAPNTHWPIFGAFSGPSAFSRVFYGTMTLSDPKGTATPSSTGGGYNLAQGNQGGANAYVPGSKQRSVYMRCPTGTARAIGGFDIEQTSQGGWQCSFTPTIPKSALERFTATLMYVIDNTP
ncbi:tail fiber lysozyme component [Xanthomonas phage Langgrundblatt2]|uniref:Tail fiber lysozyme component n=1 Tax=Xanthomonas phage Langgrundblatt2 TaxID=2939129 RepID=A0A9E7J557_9CAUD|nr:tail fiber lysozyme component [Xanthomonas phage Langgrundblatt2]URA06880.1 tail fiber lysozyme component [Xanthomonas phage Langgrundblatt2]